MDNSINFKGAFLLHQPSIYVQRHVSKAIGTNNQIIKNFSQDGDILYITEKYADKNVAKLLARYKNTNFKYYSKINPKSGFDKKTAGEISTILEDYKGKIVSNISELKKIFKLNKSAFKYSIRKRDNTLEKCMQTLDLNYKDYDIIKQNGFNEIYTKDAEKKLVAIISETDKNGFRYVRLQPMKEGDEVKRYAVLPGEKFTYINNPDSKVEDATTDFLINYIKAKNENQVIHNAKHQ